MTQNNVSKNVNFHLQKRFFTSRTCWKIFARTLSYNKVLSHLFDYTMSIVCLFYVLSLQPACLCPAVVRNAFNTWDEPHYVKSQDLVSTINNIGNDINVRARKSLTILILRNPLYWINDIDFGGVYHNNHQSINLKIFSKLVLPETAAETLNLNFRL